MKLPIRQGMRAGMKLGMIAGSGGVPVGLVVNNQTIDFGDKTAEAEGNYTLIATGGTITSASITSGDASSHWTIATNGDLTPSAAGAAADLNLGPYSLACDYNSGEATATHTVPIEADAFTVANDTEMNSLMSPVAGQQPVYGDTVRMRGGIYNDAEADQRIKREGTDFTGTPSAKITIKPVEGDEVTWRRLQIDNNSGGGGDGFVFENIIWERKTNTGVIFAQQFGITGLTFKNCIFRFKAGADGDNVVGVQLGYNGFAVNDVHFDDCTLYNLDNGILAVGSGYEMNNVTMHDIFTDGLIHGADATFPTPNNVKLRNVIVYDKKYGGTGSHGDFLQLNWGVDGIGPITGLEIDNVKMFRGDGTSEEADGQGVFIPEITSGFIVGAKFINISYFATFANGLLAQTCQDSEFIGCTILFDETDEAGTPISADAILNSRFGVDNIIKDCIFNIWNDTNSTGTDDDNNLVIASTTVAYSAMFKDPQYGSDLTPANLYASFENKAGSTSALAIPEVGAFAYSTLPGANVVAISAHPRIQTATGLSFTNETDSDVSTQFTSNAATLTGIGVYGALVTVDSGEFRISETNNTTINDWGSTPQIIQNGKRLEVRNTSSSSADTAVNTVVNVGATTTTWVITTAASYTQNVLLFDDVTNSGGNFYQASSLDVTSSNKVFIYSLWFDLTQGLSNYSYNSVGVQVIRTGTAIRVDLRNSSGDLIFRNQATVGSVARGRTHFMLSVDLAVPASDRMYLDDVLIDVDASTFVNDNIAHGDGPISVGARATVFDKWRGRQADILYNDSYLDLDVLATRRRFIDASGDPVDPGSDGSTAIGTTPLIYMQDMNINGGTPTASFMVNAGRGGDILVQSGFAIGEIIISPFA